MDGGAGDIDPDIHQDKVLNSELSVLQLYFKIFDFNFYCFTLHLAPCTLYLVPCTFLEPHPHNNHIIDLFAVSFPGKKILLEKIFLLFHRTTVNISQKLFK
jgi:hypothetical protein